MTKLLITIFILSSVFSLTASAGIHENPCAAREGFCMHLAQVPGLEFLDLPKDAKIGDILAAIYKFALGLIAISALVMFVFGGVMYMTAGDSQDRAKTARGYLSNSILGLIIALLSWLALFTVNPDLVQRLEVDTIEINKPVLDVKPPPEMQAVDKETGVTMLFTKQPSPNMTPTERAKAIAEIKSQCDQLKGRLREERPLGGGSFSYSCIK